MRFEFFEKQSPTGEPIFVKGEFATAYSSQMEMVHDQTCPDSVRISLAIDIPERIFTADSVPISFKILSNSSGLIKLIRSLAVSPGLSKYFGSSILVNSLSSRDWASSGSPSINPKQMITCPVKSAIVIHIPPAQC